MHKWLIVADSSCDLNSETFDCGEIGFETVPLKIRVGDKEFVDIPSTDPRDMITAIKNHSGTTSSACPSPEEFAEQFRKGENVFAVTITGNLSGTYNCALQAKNLVLDEFPDRKIHVVDSWSTGGSMVLLVRKLRELIEQGLEFEEIVKQIDEYRDLMRIVFSLSSYDTLVKNGRMSAVAGIMATALNIRAVAHNPGGVIKVLEKPRGLKKAIERMVATMERFQFKPGTPVIVNHCDNITDANTLCEAIKAKFGIPDSDITVVKCACLTTYYAGDQSILVSFEGILPEECK